MNPLNILTRPARTAGAVAAAGLRTTSRVVGWAVGSSQPTDTATAPDPRPVAIVPDPPAGPATKSPAKKAPATKAPAKKAAVKRTAANKTPAKKAAARKTPAKKAPSKKAAVLAPALGLSESEVNKKIGDKG